MAIPYEVYRDKVRGGWLGKCVAGNMGAPLECCKQQLQFERPEQFAPDLIFPNDDLDLQLIWIKTLLEKGAGLTSDDLMNNFIQCYASNPNEYGYGKRNYMRGIPASSSGILGNGFFMNSMGCPIRAEIWALIFPGDPESAMRYAALDGALDHGPESVLAEQFTAALESMAFLGGELSALITAARDLIPTESRFYRMVCFCLDLHVGGTEWPDFMRRLMREYGHNDCSTMLYNVAVEIGALLYGDGDFEKTVTLALNCGFDTDCTLGTVGAVLGILGGTEALSERWIRYAGNDVVTACTDLGYQVDTIDELIEWTCKIGAYMSRSGRGAERIEGNPHEDFVLPEGEPLPLIRIHYPELPEIAPGEARTVELSVHQNGAIAVPARFEVRTDSPLVVSPPEGDIRFGADAVAHIALRVSMPPHCTVVPDTNVFQVHITDEAERELTRGRFGIAAKQTWRVLGPHWNPYDFKAVSKQRREQEGLYFDVPSAKIFRYLGLAEAHNNFVDLDEAYLREDFSDRAFDELFQEGTLYAASEDELHIDEMFGFSGACCVYALAKMEMDHAERVQFHIGSTTPFRLWVNGEPVHQSTTSKGYSPYNELPFVELAKGANRIAVKLLRYQDGQRFSLVMRREPYQHSGLILTGMKWHVN